MKTLVIIALCAGLCSAQEIRRPQADSDMYGLCAGFHNASGAMPNSHDNAGQSTASSIGVGGTITCTQYSCTNTSLYSTRLFSNWQAPQSTYTSLTLSINSSSPGWQIVNSGQTGAACIYYRTVNAGAWTQIRCDSGPGWANITDTITLNPAQDLAQLQVAACVEGHTSDGTRPPPPPGVGADSMTITDIWTSANASNSNSGTGSTAGRRHGAVIVK